MCNCIQAVNNELAERKANTEIHVPFTLSKITRVCIETEKVDGNKRGKPMKVFASFCPFCGQEYAAQQPLAPDAGDSAASSGIVHASAESTSRADPAPTQRG